ncbi:copper resistance protein NlpE [Echinicola jeungdonensis]|uniref:Copper resistance protein NlpE N-terminal domain-containing protein n=1 Tax=Echinicola jeungdonensis TaxID=709343 RepID=A0ABV5J0X2_9BACT|nr:copper resistance protein NlpE [Echinicola jeungdonensis]MDN3668307.1 copper resistance protein NlpE [Echinicola jeungdonensis]
MKLCTSLFAICIGLLCLACDPSASESENSGTESNSLEDNNVILETGASKWYTYEGTVPCADCEGIKMELRLENKPNKKERAYELLETYLKTDEGNRSFEYQGIYEVTYGLEEEPDAMVITLWDQNNSIVKSFVQEQSGNLTMLNQQNKRIKSPLNYSLEKK